LGSKWKEDILGLGYSKGKRVRVHSDLGLGRGWSKGKRGLGFGSEWKEEGVGFKFG